MIRRLRRLRWGLPLRATVAVVLLALLLRKVHWSSLVPDPHASDALWLAGALVVTLVGIVLATLRWRQVLAALGLPAPTGTLLSHELAGLFVGNFLPSTIGGDVLRVSRLSAANGDRPDSFASVVLERLTGWLVLPVLTLAAMAVNPGLLQLGRASAVALGLSAGTLLLLAGVLAAAASPRLGGRLVRSEGWVRFVGAVHLGLARFRDKPRAAVEVLLVGVAYQLAVVLAAFLAAHALGLDVSPTAALAFMPAVAIAQVLPISVGGLGVREGAFVLFLGPLGVPAGQAVALGLLVYGLNLAVSLLGAPAFAVGGGTGRGSDTAPPSRALA
ncbi:MAG TPA: lysylphosphatidylglycerol synthase transmembrane domain-containing protein [Acidimicrobiales bacterium]|nr:lysylphosphatidylglycerol synthase transmembrane domain-containing protein [Acidimicrobiales bacterium]